MTALDDLYILYPLDSMPVLPLTVTEIGASCWPLNRCAQRQQSTIMAIEWVVSGEMRLTQDGRVSRVRGGDVFVLKYGSSHRYVTVSDEVRKRFIGLGGELARQMLKDLPDCLTPLTVTPVKKIFDRLLALFRHQTDDWQLDAAACGYRLCAQLEQTARQSDRQRRHPAVEQALRLIHSRGWRRVSVPWLAGQTGISAAHLTRLFRMEMGETPVAYARRQMVEQAKFLLLNSSLSCKSIAAQLGFDDPLYFSAVFKAVTGEPPSWYKSRGLGAR